MQRLFRYVLLFALLALPAAFAAAQINLWQAVHSVKKKETLTGIARQYGITVDELMKANPEVCSPGKDLKKGARLFIPYSTGAPSAKSLKMGNASRPIRLGVMLPLNSRVTDGIRMVEYYRGVLMACDSLKKQGISVSIRAWDVQENTSVSRILDSKEAKELDLLIGPYYASKMQLFSDFSSLNNVMLMVPFALNSTEVERNAHIFQACLLPDDIDAAAVDNICRHFKGYHPVVIDCSDEKSTKGAFTKALREAFKAKNIRCSLTSIKTPTNSFLKAFEDKDPNLVILNSGSSQAMTAVFDKLTLVMNLKPKAKLTVMGHAEWQADAARAARFYKYDVYLPATMTADMKSARARHFSSTYRNLFHVDMRNESPRLAMAGFDQAFFFLKGLSEYGPAFDGASGRVAYTAMQSPMSFVRVGNGGYKNYWQQFLHYDAEKSVVETVTF